MSSSDSVPGAKSTRSSVQEGSTDRTLSNTSESSSPSPMSPGVKTRLSLLLGLPARRSQGPRARLDGSEPPVAGTDITSDQRARLGSSPLVGCFLSPNRASKAPCMNCTLASCQSSRGRTDDSRWSTIITRNIVGGGRLGRPGPLVRIPGAGSTGPGWAGGSLRGGTSSRSSSPLSRLSGKRSCHGKTCRLPSVSTITTTRSPRSSSILIERPPSSLPAWACDFDGQQHASIYTHAAVYEILGFRSFAGWLERPRRIADCIVGAHVRPRIVATSFDRGRTFHWRSGFGAAQSEDNIACLSAGLDKSGWGISQINTAEPSEAARQGERNAALAVELIWSPPGAERAGGVFAAGRLERCRRKCPNAKHCCRTKERDCAPCAQGD